jgi:hypothetical protein
MRDRRSWSCTKASACSACIALLHLRRILFCAAAPQFGHAALPGCRQMSRAAVISKYKGTLTHLAAFTTCWCTGCNDAVVCANRLAPLPRARPAVTCGYAFAPVRMMLIALSGVAAVWPAAAPYRRLSSRTRAARIHGRGQPVGRWIPRGSRHIRGYGPRASRRQASCADPLRCHPASRSPTTRSRVKSQE